jgi:hypothetical protein
MASQRRSGCGGESNSVIGTRSPVSPPCPRRSPTFYSGMTPSLLQQRAPALLPRTGEALRAQRSTYRNSGGGPPSPHAPSGQGGPPPPPDLRLLRASCPQLLPRLILSPSKDGGGKTQRTPNPRTRRSSPPTPPPRGRDRALMRAASAAPHAPSSGRPPHRACRRDAASPRRSGSAPSHPHPRPAG